MQIEGLMEAAICLQTPGPDGYNISPLIWGPPGYGKTSALRSLDFERFEALTISIHDPTDFGGIPCLSEDRSMIRYATPSWAVFDENVEALLALDDLTTASPAQMNACMRLVLERRVGSYTLPKCVRIAAAANTEDDDNNGGLSRLSRPLANRFVHVKNWKITASSFAKSLEEGFAKPELPRLDPRIHSELVRSWSSLYAAFLRRVPTAFSSKANDEDPYPESFASCRTIDFAIRLCASCDLLGLAPRMGGGTCKSTEKQNGSTLGQDSPVFFNLLCGSIGSGTGIAFLKFIRDNDIPDPDEVLDGRARVGDFSKMRDDQVHILFTALCSAMIKRHPDSRTSNLEPYHGASLRLLELIAKLEATHKLDAAYVPVKGLVQSQWLQGALSAARQLNRLAEFQKASAGAFSDHGEFSRFITLIETPPTEKKKRAISKR